MEELKKLIEEQGLAWEEFKKTNDARIAAVEAGKGTADFEAKLAKINEDLSALSKSIADAERKASRPPAGGAEIDQDQAEHKAAFAKYARKGDEAGLRDAERKVMKVSSDPDGGYFASEEIEAGVLRLAGANVAMMRLATVKTIGAAAYRKRVRTSGTGHEWVGEGVAATEATTPKYGVLEFRPGTIACAPQVSQESLEDLELNVESELTDAIGQEFAEGIGEAAITGNGVGKPRGILGYTAVANASYAWGKVGYIASGKSGAFADTDPADCLISLQHALKSAYRANGRFLMADGTLETVRKFKDGMGNYIWQPGLQLGAPSLLLGKPVETDDFMPTVEANSYSIAFGDFARAYVIVQRRGISVLRDPYTAKPFTVFYTTARVGGGIQNFEAIKLLKFAAS